jgi:hypothetical protein
VAGLPNICGAIDGSEIPLKQPNGAADNYINRKSRHSMKLQVVCDAQGVFMDACTGFSGRWHDKHAYASSGLHEALRTGALGTRMRTSTVSLYPKLPDALVGLQIIADFAYPCEDVMLPAFKHTLVSQGARRTFNKKHAQTRRCVERALGRLKGQWRILTRDCDLSV